MDHSPRFPWTKTEARVFLVFHSVKAEWQWKKYQLCTQNSSMRENYEKKRKNISNVCRTSEAYARKSKQHDLHYRSRRARWAFFVFSYQLRLFAGFFHYSTISTNYSWNYWYVVFITELMYFQKKKKKLRPENCFIVASVVNSERLHSKSHSVYSKSLRQAKDNIHMKSLKHSS